MMPLKIRLRTISNILLLAFAVFGLATPRHAAAHPMGNFSINHYTRLTPYADHLAVRHIIDFAEIPTVTEQTIIDTNHDGRITPEETHAYFGTKAARIRSGLHLSIDGNPEALQVVSENATLIPGAGGLNTLRITLDLTAPWHPLATMTHGVYYSDANYPKRTGWKEIVAVADPPLMIENSTAGATDISRQLTRYPKNLSVAPPAQTQASFTVRLVEARQGGPPVRISPYPHQDLDLDAYMRPHSQTPTDAFTQAIAVKDLTPGLMLAGLLLAFVFGAFHALSPGHGKTMVAAYLVGARGTIKHAVLLGIVVTITHTFGVFMLGFVTLYLSQYIVPEQLYPILSAISGAAVFGVGVWLLVSRLRGAPNHAHAHEHGDQGHGHDEDDHERLHALGLAHSHANGIRHDHANGHHSHADAHEHGHGHGHGHGHHHHVPDGPITAKSLIALGVSGGIVPCPSALVVLLSAIALHRIAYGLVLISAFSLGLASVLVIIGMLVVTAGNWLKKLPASERIAGILPIASAAAITGIGVILIARALGYGAL